MRYVNSYLSEVGRFLPARQRSDILGELRATLEEHAQDLAGDQPVNATHEKTAIEALGHPMKVASEFRGPRYLIGPTLFPTFVETLKIVLVIVTVIQCALLLAGYVTLGNTISAGSVIRGVIDNLAWTSLIVLLVFVAIEAGSEHVDLYDRWSANSLSLRAGAPVNVSDQITNLVSEGVFLLWWNGALVFQNWIPGLGDMLPVGLGPVWDTLYWPLNVVAGAWFVLHAWVLMRGLWQTSTLVAEIALGVAALLLCAWLLTQPPLLDLAAEFPERAAAILHRAVTTVIVVVAGFIAWDTWAALRRLRDRGGREVTTLAL